MKCLTVYDVNDGESLRHAQDQQLLALEKAADASGHEFLLEVVPPRSVATETCVIAAVEHLYEVGLTPDWWKLPPSPDPIMWQGVGDLIRKNDPYARGILVLGLDMPEQDLGKSFAGAATEPTVRGFAIGRTIFWPAAELWFAGDLDDAGAVSMIGESFTRVRNLWPSAAIAQMHRSEFTEAN